MRPPALVSFTACYRSALVFAAERAAAKVIELSRFVNAGDWACCAATASHDRAVFHRATIRTAADLGRACTKLEEACAGLRRAGMGGAADDILRRKDGELARGDAPRARRPDASSLRAGAADAAGDFGDV